MRMFIIIFFPFLIMISCSGRAVTASPETVSALPNYDKNAVAARGGGGLIWNEIILIINNRNEPIKTKVIIERNGAYKVQTCEKSGLVLDSISMSPVSDAEVKGIDDVLYNNNFFNLKNEYAVYATDHETNVIIVRDDHGNEKYSSVYNRDAFIGNEEVERFYRFWNYLVNLRKK